MAVPAALIQPIPLVQTPSISTPSATTSPPSTTSSPSPSVGPSGQNLFRTELLANSSPGISTPTGTLPSKPVYSTPSPVENTPQNNECKMVDLRGAKVASFTVDGCELICLPQAFDLFLKHLVGGLHTVYTKLKRLEITPVVCNVEQVRILRGLGAIQPGVNRCKLISRKDFETLYNDCTNASSRPGRPPKRTQSVTSSENPHIMPHSVPGLMSPGTFPSSGLELPFMMMPHPLIPCSLPPASVTMAMSQMNHLSTIANMAAVAQQQSLPCRMVTSVIKDQDWETLLYSNMADVAQQQSLPCRMVTSVIKERVPDSPSPTPSLEDGRRPGSHPSSHRSSSVSSSPAHTESSSDRIRTSPYSLPMQRVRLANCVFSSATIHQNGLSMNQMNQALLGLSPSILPGPKEGDLAHDMSHEAKRMHKDDNPMCTPTARDSYERLSLTGQGLPPGFPSPFLFPDGLSSIETLLTNIQGLLKVAIDNARAQEKQVQLEKTELKMELFRERELRETLEKQLAIEQKNRAIIQKRLKKEKKAKRKLQEALEYESKRREQAEQSLKQPSPSEGLRSLNDSLTPETESDRSAGRTDAERTIQDGRLFLKTTVMY
ncbi:dachshund homolog 1 isoform X4 [Salmo salar]|uniref:Dachshund homolog 1 isoform X4 n=1 Tax=Salmo salar TaxID=8030 RepID=A0A1S3PL13_SALSA|nr:dachshund homolog 1 isoform X4 [Salmo salar]|eukprot:XP_014028342.1 PREDICTED: dachshund homolog 1-like isoform X4 [Salmo salar]